MIAEWEPAKGVLVGWPLGIPYKLFIQFTKDTKVYVTVNGREAMQSAIKSFTAWGILPDQVRFVLVPQGPDYFWVRDWGPPSIFTHEGEYKLIDPDYSLSTPKTGMLCGDTLHFLFKDDTGNPIPLVEENRAPSDMASDLGWEVIKMPVAFTGGNVMADGQRTAFSTCALITENDFLKKPIDKVRTEVLRATGIEQYQIISNFETSGIQHIDCLLKLLDEETMLVLRVPEDHPSYDQIEGIVENELKQVRTAFGKPFTIHRIDSDYFRNKEIASYTNSLILNKKIYVPQFGIAQDKIAVDQWQQVMPGYEIMPFEYEIKKEPNVSQFVKDLYKDEGWVEGDALHCRTRGVWDDKMVYLSVDKIPSHVAKEKFYNVNVIIRDYSGSGLETKKLKLLWRVRGETNWKESQLESSAIPDHFNTRIPGNMAGVSIEYYVQASNLNQQTYLRPVTAPSFPYSFSID